MEMADASDELEKLRPTIDSELQELKLIDQTVVVFLFISVLAH